MRTSSRTTPGRARYSTLYKHQPSSGQGQRRERAKKVNEKRLGRREKETTVERRPIQTIQTYFAEGVSVTVSGTPGSSDWSFGGDTCCDWLICKCVSLEGSSLIISLSPLHLSRPLVC